MVHLIFSYGHATLYEALSVRPSVRPSVGERESKSVKARISAPAHPSATGGRESGLVLVADTQLYKRPCPSVRPFVRW